MVFTIQQEYEAFKKALPSLLPSHRNEFVLQKDGVVVAFFDTYDTAYATGLSKFGLNGAFLVAKIEEVSPSVISYALSGGVMFG
jgi:hypothetical protein